MVVDEKQEIEPKEEPAKTDTANKSPPKEDSWDEDTAKNRGADTEDALTEGGDSSIDPEVGPFVCKYCREEFKTWAVLTRKRTVLFLKTYSGFLLFSPYTLPLQLNEHENILK